MPDSEFGKKSKEREDRVNKSEEDSNSNDDSESNEITSKSK